jgi:hypothetical protein
MKKGKKQSSDMLPEYDFAKMKGGVRGKYAKRYRAGTNGCATWKWRFSGFLFLWQ